MYFNVWSCGSQALLQQVGSAYQRDKVSERQLDLDLHLVFGMNCRPNILVVAFEQVTDQLCLLITLHCVKK